IGRQDHSGSGLPQPSPTQCGGAAAQRSGPARRAGGRETAGRRYPAGGRQLEGHRPPAPADPGFCAAESAQRDQGSGPGRPQGALCPVELAVMIDLMVSGVVSNLMAALIGCLLMGAFKCITMDSAYRSIHWPSLILIVGMLPFALALQKTGGIDLAVGGLLELFGDAGPRVLLATLFIATAVTGLFISNTATAV